MKLLLSALVLTFSFSAFAQLRPSDEEIRERANRLAQYSIVVRGSENPRGIPYGEKMGVMFGFLATQQTIGQTAFERDLYARAGGNEADIKTLTELASMNREFDSTVSAQESAEIKAICEETVATNLEQLDARALAARFAQVRRNRLDRMETHYKEALDRVSTSVRDSLLVELETSIVPNMSWGYTDDVGLAAEFPMSYVKGRVRKCEEVVKKGVEADAPARLERFSSGAGNGIMRGRQ